MMAVQVDMAGAAETSLPSWTLRMMDHRRGRATTNPTSCVSDSVILFGDSHAEPSLGRGVTRCDLRCGPATGLGTTGLGIRRGT